MDSTIEKIVVKPRIESYNEIRDEMDTYDDVFADNSYKLNE